MPPSFPKPKGPRHALRLGLLWMVIGSLWSMVFTSYAQPSGEVRTIGGAFAGWRDGNNEVSQFNTPTGLALDAGENLYVADFGNNFVRKLRLSDQLVTTYAAVLQPIAVSVDVFQNLYVLSQAEGKLYKLDPFGNFFPTPVLSGLNHPTALATDTNGSVYVAEIGGIVTRVDSNGVRSASIYRSPVSGSAFSGVAVTQDKHVVVSDAGLHVIWAFDAP